MKSGKTKIATKDKELLKILISLDMATILIRVKRHAKKMILVTVSHFPVPDVGFEEAVILVSASIKPVCKVQAEIETMLRLQVWCTKFQTEMKPLGDLMFLTYVYIPILRAMKKFKRSSMNTAEVSTVILTEVKHLMMMLQRAGVHNVRHVER